MKAIVAPRYGRSDVLRLDEVQRPVPTSEDILVRVHAASVNPFDWHMMTGVPILPVRPGAGLRRPKITGVGSDFAGMVVEVGEAVTRWRPGDEVFGIRRGSIAEYLCVNENGLLAGKPPSLSFVEAAAVPLAALTAWQGLVDMGRIEIGHRVLVIGAAGGVGTFAVQIAKAYGAHVTGVCSTGKAELMGELGADRVIDYTRQPVLDGDRYDLILDNVGTTAILARRRALTANGILVPVTGPKQGRWLGPMTAFAAAFAVGKLPGPRVRPFVMRADRDDLISIAAMIESGVIRPIVDRTYPIERTAEAMTHVGSGHARAKVVVTMVK